MLCMNNWCDFFCVWFQVRWFQQQHEKVRKKRDYTADFYNYQKFGLLRSIAPQTRLQYRQVGEPLFFPDPFFKEQWYLVSLNLTLLYFTNVLKLFARSVASETLEWFCFELETFAYPLLKFPPMNRLLY